MKPLLLAIFVNLALSCISMCTYAQQNCQSCSFISIIIDDMGNNLALGKRALSLPGEISYSFLPDAPYSIELAKQAHRDGRQVLLHLPMQGHVSNLEEKNTLNTTMANQDFLSMLNSHLSKIPFIIGSNNHMGSILTAERERMDWIMQEIKGRKLFFVDSRTTRETVAYESANSFGVRFSQRDVFLDNVKTDTSIRTEFARFLALAKKKGSAIAIAHPHPTTLETLEDLLTNLDTTQVKLVDVSTRLDKQKNVILAELED